MLAFMLLGVEPVDIDEIAAAVAGIQDADERSAVAKKLLEAAVAAVTSIEDDEQRMQATHALMAVLHVAETTVSDTRHFAARALKSAGWQFPDFYASLDVDKTMVQAILRGRAGLKREQRERD